MEPPVPDREWVRRRTADLRESFGEFPVDESELEDPHEVPADHFLALAGAEWGPYLGRAGVRLRRPPESWPAPSDSMPEAARAEEDRLLLIRTRSEQCWNYPGGGLEPGETYPEAARRELREETGIEGRITGIAGVEHWVAVPDEPVPEADLDAVHVLNVVFEGEYEGGQLRPQPAEIAGACWFRELPGALHEDVENVESRDGQS
jgi:ADP-ribose pyrophosphatase YjhB (NUDIX family)